MTDTTPKPPKTSRGIKSNDAAPSRLSMRNQRQAEYQRAYRADQKAARRPSRDDVARTFLHWAITRAIAKERFDYLEKVRHQIVDHLVAQGFDGSAARRRFDDLIESYEEGWTFQAKPHLRVRPDDGTST
jgi:hypothetical protein